MSLYLIQTAYTGESWKTQIQKRENVEDRIRPIIENLGGHIVGLYYTFGDYDLVGLMDMPSNEAAAAFALAVNAGGALRAFKTTPLLTVEQGREAMKMASEAGSKYRAPVGASTG
ncbi:MAG: hypothetical protein NVS4B2_21640 [Chloroflexota bacterium]